MRRMNRFVTALLILLSAAGIAVAMKIVKEEQALSVARQEQVSKLTEQLQPIEEQRKELQNQEEEWEKTLEQGEKGTPCVLLTFDTMDEELYETMYDMMDQYGFRGNFVIRDGVLPGSSEDVITTEQFEEMIESGWEYALELTDDTSSEEAQSEEEPETETEEAWEDQAEGEEPQTEDTRSYRDKADSYLNLLEEYGYDLPQTLLCTQAQYADLTSEYILGRGFQAVCVLAQDQDTFPTIGEKEDRLWVIDSGIYTQQIRDLETQIQTAIQKQQSIAITINEILKISQDATYDLSISRFGSLLNTLKNLEEQGEINIVTYSEFCQYGEEQEQAYKELVNSYSMFRQEMEEQLDDLDRQEQEIVASLQITEAAE